jgi:tricorn protease-like protein
MNPLLFVLGYSFIHLCKPYCFPFSDENTLVVQANLQRLKSKANTHDFNGILLCRPTPTLPIDAYRVIEGTKRAVAYRIAEREGFHLPVIHCYFGDYE